LDANLFGESVNMHQVIEFFKAQAPSSSSRLLSETYQIYSPEEKVVYQQLGKLIEILAFFFNKVS
jgi:hypothetical protein